MKFFLPLILLILVATVNAQEEQKIQGLISNPEVRVLYRGYSNYLEYYTCASCDSVFIDATNAKITWKNNYTFILYTEQMIWETAVTVNCIRNKDTSVLWTQKYRVKKLPNPNIYLGGIDLNKDLNKVKEASLFAQVRFSARYDETVPLTHIIFRVTEWSITVGKTEFKATNANLTEAYKAAIISARRKTPIIFNYVTVRGPDGIERKIVINRTYYKKQKHNSTYEEDPRLNDILYPQSGG